MTEPGDPSPGADRPGTRERLRSLAVDTSPLRRYPAFRRLFVGQTVSTFGSEIAAVAAPFQLYDLTHSTLQVGLLSLCELVPLLTLTIAGGAIADAFDRRTLLFRTESLLAVVAALFAVNAALPEPRVWAIYVLVTLAMAIFSLGVAGMSSLIPRLVEQEDLVAANALESVYSSTTSVAGPAVAGVLIAALGLPLAYALDSITFAASLWSIWRLPRLPPAHDADRPSLRSIAEGFRYVKAKKVVLGMFVVDSSAMVFGMPRALFPAMAVSRFDGGAGVLGLLYAAPYAGALVSSLLSGWIARVRRQGLYVAVAAACWGLAIAAFGFAESLWVALILLALAGAADNVSAVLRSTILWTVTPESLRGRVAGIEFAQVASTPSLGNVEAGVVASLTSVRFSIVSGGLLCVVAAAVTVALVPALRYYDARPRAAPA
ncbi:MAG: MFS transporter [Gaiellaceae bacterium]